MGKVPASSIVQLDKEKGKRANTYFEISLVERTDLLPKFGYYLKDNVWYKPVSRWFQSNLKIIIIIIFHPLTTG